jgi:hypothetical protein
MKIFRKRLLWISLLSLALISGEKKLNAEVATMPAAPMAQTTAPAQPGATAQATPTAAPESDASIAAIREERDRKRKERREQLELLKAKRDIEEKKTAEAPKA